MILVRRCGQVHSFRVLDRLRFTPHVYVQDPGIRQIGILYIKHRGFLPRLTIGALGRRIRVHFFLTKYFLTKETALDLIFVLQRARFSCCVAAAELMFTRSPCRFAHVTPCDAFTRSPRSWHLRGTVPSPFNRCGSTLAWSLWALTPQPCGWLSIVMTIPTAFKLEAVLRERNYSTILCVDYCGTIVSSRLSCMSM